MLTKTVLFSSFAALALAKAAANPAPQVTAAPIRRDAGDVGDKIDELAGDAGDKAEEIASKAGTKLDDLKDKAGTKVDDLKAGASSLISEVGDEATKIGKCSSAFESLTDYPTPTGDLADALMTGAIGALSTDVCKIGEDLDEDLQEDWTSFKASASEWYSKNSAAVKSAADACPTALGLDDLVNNSECITGEKGGKTGDDEEEGSAARFTGIAAAVGAVAVGAAAILL
ncbi:hypothetical protein IMZ48_21135 [Candidatus Bathyarchaeota archaeon]|nr:hypothetical protein [Candidatus Bathyarchaeota archaeon]